jgi:Uma2 family endonuclease
MATKLLFRAEDLEWLQSKTGKRLELVRGEPVLVPKAKLLFGAQDLDWLQSKTGKRLELVRGEPVEVPTGFPHGQVVMQVAYLFLAGNREHRWGRFASDAGYMLQHEPDTVRGPDISFFRAGRTPSPRGFREAIPDFIVEVRSPNDSWQEIVDKTEEFFAHGTELAWLVQIGHFVEVRRPGQEPFRLGLDDVLTAEDMLPGFSCRVRDLFPVADDLFGPTRSAGDAISAEQPIGEE